MGCINYGTAPIEVEKAAQTNIDAANQEQSDIDTAKES